MATLSELPAFAGLPDAVIADIAEHVHEIVIQPGAHLCREGSQALEAFILLEGTAQLIAHGQVIRTIDQGELIGEIAVLSGKPRTASIRAVTVIKAFVLRPQDVRWLSEDPNAGGVVQRALSRHLQSVRQAPAISDLRATEVLDVARRGGATLALAAGSVLRRTAEAIAARSHQEKPAAEGGTSEEPESSE